MIAARPITDKMLSGARARFLSYVPEAAKSDCWEWAGARGSFGYGRFKVAQYPYHAHRIAVRLTGVQLGPYDVVCHRCDNPPCVNPAHLRWGTHLDNVRDKIAKGRSGLGGFCPTGEGNPRAILTEDHVRAIRDEAATIRALGAKYGVSPSTIQDIRTGRSWRHVQ